MDIDRERIFRKTLKKWGILAQLLMAAEECSELIQAIFKLYRANDDTLFNPAKASAIEEMADVQIMLDQLKVILNCESEVEKQYQIKLARLQERLNDGH